MDLAITSLGMISAIGHGVVAACAALRCGVTRPRPFSGADVLDADTGEAIPVVGHPVAGVTEGFYLSGLWLRLAEAAVRDLVASGDLPGPEAAGFWGDCDVTLVVPRLDPERFPVLEDAETASAMASEYAEGFADLARLPLSAARIQVLAAGHAGVAQALLRASERASAGESDRCLIVAVDSYLEPDALDWLARHRRLKGPDLAAGMAPGEAGAAVLVESSRGLRARKGGARARVDQVALGAPPSTRQAEAGRPLVPDGAGLASAVAPVLEPGAGFSGDLFADLNGEAWRAQDYGMALVKLGSRVGEPRLILPAASLGDTGAASGAVALCAATRAFERGYARGPVALVLSTSENGDAGAIRLGRA